MMYKEHQKEKGGDGGGKVMRTHQPSSSSSQNGTKCSSDAMKEDHWLFKEVDSDECGENVPQTHAPLS